MVLIADLPADQRPRERLLRLGHHALTDAEIVAVLLSAGRSGESAVALAHRVLHTVGGVPGLTRTRPDRLTRLAGVGPAKAARLLAALALPARSDPMDETRVLTNDDLAPVLRPLLVGLHHERLVLAVCDRRLRVLHVAPVADGATDGAPLPIRDILGIVLRHDGHAFAIGHNHPSGDPTPSPADQAATRRLSMVAQSVGLQFLGHLVFGGAEWRAV